VLHPSAPGNEDRSHRSAALRVAVVMQFELKANNAEGVG
jgi:hypothetical protein